ncbi:MAG: uracil-DNA glycosylase family protein [Hyphomicrobium sp.]|uniref:uracil-DNA glycosylase n=1 Tax=Hyphomicrobium sp. TaxID=82 RepID=UPI003561BF93
MDKPASREEMLALLDWFQAMGADAAVDETSCDWLARGPTPPGAAYAWPRPDDAQPLTQPESAPTRRLPAQSPTAETTRPRAATPLGASEAETGARRIAREAGSLEALEAALKTFDGCGLKATATKLCFYRGAPTADLMIVGEAPGRDEDLEGKPFIGRAGHLLDKMLAAIGLGETSVHITNIVYWRPPGNRTPTPQEALACRPFLERQIELVSPKIVVAVGGSAAKELFGVAEGIMRLRGKWREIAIGQRKIQAIATLHPAYLLRTPAAKNLVWQDLLQIRSKL